MLFRNNEATQAYLMVTPYTHVGVVIQTREGELGIAEMHQLHDGLVPDQEGVQFHAMRQRLADPRWTKFLVPLRGAVSMDRRDAFFDSLPALHEAIPYNYDYIKDGLACRLLPWKHTIAKSMQCANFAALALQALGVARTDQRIDCLAPPDVPGLALEQGYEYDAPIHIAV